MFELIRQCVEDDREEAWGDLWQLYLQIAMPVARRDLIRHGYCYADVEDIVMESALSLCNDSYRRLKSFRGESQWELCAWFRQVVLNHSRNRRIQKGRCNHAMFTIQPSEVALPAPLADIDVELFLRDLAECAAIAGFRLSSNDVRHLRILAGLDAVPVGTSVRTIRHWKRTLWSRLEHLV